MGVHGLWELLAPVGRRVSVETLAGKKLAIDASIWMVQFMKAMRDEKGEMVRNAHLLGFFRRICKLLYLRTKPVFVFDGGTPALKRRTVVARRRMRENAQAKVRKTAEKLLLNHLKAMKLKELAEDIKNQRQKQKNDAKGKEVSLDQANLVGNDFGKNDVSSINFNQEKLDEMLAASIMAEEGEKLANNSTKSTSSPCEEDDYGDEVMILPDMQGEVDADVLAALTPSLRLDLLNQKQKQDNDDKGKKIMSDKAGSNLERDGLVSSSCNQEKLDEMLAASLMEEENRSFINKASTSAAPYPVEDDDMDEDEDLDEEMILPAMDGEVDPSILASLPPSMQLDLLVQIRERLMADNRQKYQKVKKDPAKFSELQIEAYLKTVAFRREIDQVQKVASGRGVGGVQTSRIASEANKEFIFSSSFTGDKQVLAPVRAEKCGDRKHAEDPSSVMHSAASTSKSNTVTGSKPQDSRRVFDGSIETYRDERGRVRVSRVRAMGIRMTRDLQRNLDLMKEIENERENLDCHINESNGAVPKTLYGFYPIETSRDGAESIKPKDTNEDSVLKDGASMEISFEDDGDIKCLDGDDEIFAHLVAGNPLKISSDNIMSVRNVSDASDSDSFWEEGTTEAKDKNFSDDTFRMELPSKGNNSDDDSEVEWEEGVCELTKHTSSESKKVNSKGNLEEEADLQEAIRRSLVDIGDQKSNSALPEDDKLEVPKGFSCEGIRFPDPENRVEVPTFSGDDGSHQNRSTCEILDGVENPDGVRPLSFSTTTDSSRNLLESSVGVEAPPREVDFSSPFEQTLQEAGKRANLSKEAPYSESLTPSKAKGVHVVGEGLLCTSNDVGGSSTSFQKFAKDSSHSSVSCGDVPDGWIDQKIATEAECPLVEMTYSAVDSLEAVTNELICDIDNEENSANSKGHENCFQEIEHSLENSAVKDSEDFQVEVTEASLEEEMQKLGQERMDLGDEQRRLERNAESVSGEMFTECQELLQMFGLPYIIAPMEAEAQCAYMELANLVDGVVTDDSDAFLFGARSVYKNIFDDRKYVETYFMKDIENELGLTREQLTRMALLLGSDYTEGVSGIGIVNAIEVVHAFPEEDGLQKFRDWIESPDPTILGKIASQTDSSARKKGSKIGDDADCSKSNMEEASKSNENISEAQEQKQSADHIQDIRKIFMDKHRKVSKNWHIPPSFPSEAVVSAYFCPQVDKSTEPFTWGKPDHFVLRKLCWDKLGWGSQKADDLLVPVLKEYSKHETQLRLEAFYTFNERFAKIRSKRIKKAVKGITGKTSLESMDDAVQEVSKSKTKRKSRSDESGDDQSEKLPQETEESLVGRQWKNTKKSTPKQSRKQKIPRDGLVSESLVLSEERQDTNRKSSVNGKSRGRGRGRIAGRGKGKGSSTFESSKTSSSDGDNDDDDMEEVQIGTLERPLETRRSTRLRKPVNYTANDSEIDDLDKSIDQTDKKCFDGESSKQDLSCSSEQCDLSLGQDKKHNIEILSSSKGLDEDYIEKGGGFCPDNGDNDQPGMSQHGDSHLEAEFSEEYLKTGGGFCMEECETGPDDNSTSGRAMAAVLDNANPSHCSGLGSTDACVSEPTRDQVNPTVNDNPSKSGMLLQENDTDNTRTSPVGTLRAMPQLRKRRRKN